jgi:hypothetical protein
MVAATASTARTIRAMRTGSLRIPGGGWVTSIVGCMDAPIFVAWGASQPAETDTMKVEEGRSKPEIPRRGSGGQ